MKKNSYGKKPGLGGKSGGEGKRSGGERGEFRGARGFGKKADGERGGGKTFADKKFGEKKFGEKKFDRKSGDESRAQRVGERPRFGKPRSEAEASDFRKPKFKPRDRRDMREADDAKPQFGKSKPSFKKNEFRKNENSTPRYAMAGKSGRDKPARKFDTKRGDIAAPSSRQKEAKAHTPRQGIMLWGVHAVREAWLNPERKCFHLWATESALSGMQEVIAQAKAAKLSRPNVSSVERSEIDQMLPSGSVHQGIALEVEGLPEVMLHEVLQSETPPDLIVVLDQVTDPHNIGAVLRSAAALGAGALIMTERNAPSTTGVMAKTASGAAEHVPMIPVVNLARALTELQQAGYWCVGLAEEGKRDLGELDLSGKTAIVMGAEGDGLRRLTREHCDELARLPTGGPIPTLNVSNAAAIALYEVRRQKAKFSAR